MCSDTIAAEMWEIEITESQYSFDWKGVVKVI